ncbi:MAG: chromosome segregation protein SMC [Thermoplasmata archaeon]
MFLKEIELENFKSFGRRLRLPILSGYTAVTGPNGSGKSNISDAVIFVLGPKSSRVIRAGRLTDLIYDGGRGGKPADYCRVSLVFDNKDQAIPLEADEVRLTRYVGRSASVKDGYNSYFYVNGRKATLSDFDTLLANARISAEGYNIVQQGDVQGIVDMTPVERRRLLEDIAGISRFDEDIQRAERKRQGVEEDLERIEIILKEIRRQLRQLERDREGALHYRELQEALETARGQKAHKEIRLLQGQLASSHEQAKRYETELGRWKEELARLREALQKEGNRLKALEEQLAEEGGEEYQSLRAKLDDLRVARARTLDGRERGKEQGKELRAEMAQLRRDLKKVLAELATLRDRDQEAEDEIQRLADGIASKEAQIAKVERGASDSDTRVLELQKAAVALDLEIDERDAVCRELVLEKERLTQRRNQLDEDLGQLAEERKAQELDVKDADWQAKESSSGSRSQGKELRRFQERAAGLEEERRKLVRQSGELESAVRSLSRELSHLRAEAEAAESIRKGYNRAVSSILETRDRGELGGIHGTVAELGQVEPEFERALQVAAGARLQAIVVRDDGVAAQAIEYLKRKKHGRAIFLPLTKMLPGRPRGKALMAVREARGFALDLVSFDAKYRNAFWYVFGDTVVVEDLGQARKLMGGVRLVTLDGQLVEASGAMVGGHMEDPLLRFGKGSEGNLDRVAGELRQASKELKKVQERIRAVERELDEVGGKLKEAREAEEQRRARRGLLHGQKEQLQRRLEATDTAMTRKTQERDKVSEACQAVLDQLREAEKKLTDAKGRRKEIRVTMGEITPQRITQQLRKLQGERLNLLERRNRLESQRETQRNQINFHEERRGEYEAHLARDAERVAEERERSVDSEKTLAKLQEEILALEKLQESSLSQAREVQAKRDRAFQEKTRIEAEIAKAEGKRETTEDFLVGLESQIASLQVQIQDAEARGEASGEPSGSLPSMKEIDAEVARCEKSLNAIGAVNLRALEDYEAQERRHDELKEELGRMRRERRDLLRLAQELQTKKKQGLLAVFHALQTNFVTVYAEISEGGEADLQWENEEDPFAGGLLIRAQPPEKRFHRLEALSGGEKSLVSMAFIFALQQHDPSPFYFLDEVDQNLDAINAEKVARMVRKNAESAQFIQISLRKVSLKEADHIVGVTMGPKGVSKVIMQVNLDEIMEEEIPQTETAEAAA